MSVPDPAGRCHDPQGQGRCRSVRWLSVFDITAGDEEQELRILRDLTRLPTLLLALGEDRVRALLGV